MSKVNPISERRPHSNNSSALSRQIGAKNVTKVTVASAHSNFSFKKVNQKNFISGTKVYLNQPTYNKGSVGMNISPGTIEGNVNAGTSHNSSQMEMNGNNCQSLLMTNQKLENTPVINESKSEKMLISNLQENCNLSSRINIGKVLSKPIQSKQEVQPKLQPFKLNNLNSINYNPLHSNIKSLAFPKTNRETVNITDIKKTKINDSNFEGVSRVVSANNIMQLGKVLTTTPSRNITPNKTISKEKDMTNDSKSLVKSNSLTGVSLQKSPNDKPSDKAGINKFQKSAHPIVYNAYANKGQTTNITVKVKSKQNAAIITGILSKINQIESTSNEISTNATFISKVENKDGNNANSAKIKQDPISESSNSTFENPQIEKPKDTEKNKETANDFFLQIPCKCIVQNEGDPNHSRMNLLKERENKTEVDFRKIETSPLIRKKPPESKEEKNIDYDMSLKPKRNQMVHTSSGELKMRKELPKPQKIKKNIKLTHEFTKIGFAGPGVKKVNQDVYFIFTNFVGNPSHMFMAVCDGHGLAGHEVSCFLKENLPIDLNKALKTQNKNILVHKIDDIIENVFLETNYKLCSNEMIDCIFSGSTCVSIIYTPEKLICVNVGDSRAVLGKCVNGEWKSHNLTRDHKPTEPDEAERVTQKGGRIQPFKDEDNEFIGPPRVWLKDDEIPGLAMTRSFGDRLAATIGVISSPEITEYKFEEEDKFFIVASDGVWEFMESQECINIMKDYYITNDIAGCCEYLHQEAAMRWMKAEEVIDDITMIVVFLE